MTPDQAETVYPLNTRWTALFATATPVERARYRRVMCGVLGLVGEPSELAMVLAIQADPRGAEELAGEYLQRVGEGQ